MKYKSVLNFPDIYGNGCPIRLTCDQVRKIAEYGGVVYSNESHINLDRLVGTYLIERLKLNQGTTYADIRKHAEKVKKQIDKLIPLIDSSCETSYYFEAFIDGVNSYWLKDFKIEKLNADLKLLKEAANLWTQQKAVRNKNESFIFFIHSLSEIYLRMGGSEEEFPTGISKLVENHKNDKKEYECLFVDFVEQVILAINETLEKDKVLAQEVFNKEDFPKIENWYVKLDTYQYQSLAKKIQRALTDRPLQKTL